MHPLKAEALREYSTTSFCAYDICLTALHICSLLSSEEVHLNLLSQFYGYSFSLYGVAFLSEYLAN